jgi:rod shape determining protein RodA
MVMSSSDFVRQMPSSGHRLQLRRSWLQRMHIDFTLLITLLALTAYGMVVLYSASESSRAVMMRQGIYFVVAYIAMFVAAQLNLRFYERTAPWVYLLGLLLLVLVLYFGTGAKGAQRWLDLPGIPRFQPAEIMKLLVPMTVAWYLGNRMLPPSLKYVLVAGLLILLPAGLIVVQPDLGTSLLIATSGLLVLFFAGLPWLYIAVALGLAAASFYPAWLFLLHDYQKQRILTLLNPESDKLGAGWNIIQSKTAIGSGGWQGKGWLQGTQSHLDFLPESHTDFIIAVLAEEFGLLGVLVLMLLYLTIILRCIVICLNAQHTYGRLLAGSITVTFFVYIFVNMGMVSGLLPVVGVPLPLVSQGGTALVTLMAGFGILMAIGTEEKKIIRQ